MDKLLQPPTAEHCRIRPLSGYHFKVSVTRADGNTVFFGGFQSLTLSMRNATETYLTLGERIPMFLDGEIQIAWVLEKGMVDGDFLHNVFGIGSKDGDKYSITRADCACIPESPRFTISFTSACAPKFADANTENTITGLSEAAYFGKTFGVDTSFKMKILYCKLDNYSLGLMPGRRVAAERWEGVAEGFSKEPYTPTNLFSGRSAVTA